MCSWIPNPKLPVAEKLPFLNSYSFTCTKIKNIKKYDKNFQKSVKTTHVCLITSGAHSGQEPPQ